MSCGDEAALRNRGPDYIKLTGEKQDCGLLPWDPKAGGKPGYDVDDVLR